MKTEILQQSRNSFQARAVIIGTLVTAWTLLGAPVLAQEVENPGKDFDYVFFGYSAAHGKGGENNRNILLQDIDDNDPKNPSPKPNSIGPRYKVISASPASGRLDMVERRPGYFRLFDPKSQASNPKRFLIKDEGPEATVWSDSALEPDAKHYLRDVVDVVHDGKRTRYTSNCPVAHCEEK